KFLILRDQVRKRVGFGELCNLIRGVHAQWRPAKVWIEGEKLGWAVWDELKGQMPIECLPPGCRDKATRAAPLIVKLERGEVFLPRHNTTWRPELEQEFLAWTGHERQPADQIDAAAYAAIVAANLPHQTVRAGL